MIGKDSYPGLSAPRAKRVRPALLSKNPETAMNEMMGTIDALRAIYLEETQALQQANPQEFLALQDKKFRQAGECQKGMMEILKRRDEMQAIDPALKARLIEVQGRFSKQIRENQDSLRRMQHTVGRLKTMIGNAVRDSVAQNQAGVYGRNGVPSGTGKKIISTGLTETV
ncbi:MAG: hypothetical protein ACPGRX_02415 [Bdellovibrionales bacterium]